MIVRPVYYKIIERRSNGWAFKHGTPFINLLNAPLLAQDDSLAAFDTSMKKVAIEQLNVSTEVNRVITSQIF
ncbi:hypothetical protein NIES4071_40240 [Calothrix sp. NIES-4071]|nr:hypothetical protein NIES4071_40240 [Calothrix sp. NIES-4071]BAZ58342.1 hypothetical protein NIES4105_40180 [Calothrix sp. NIES-4105]